MDATHTRRLYFLDALRILAFALLVPYHVGMYYVSWPWHVKSATPVAALAPWMQAFSPWRMSLLFLVSGAATAALLQRGGTGLLRRRLRRLGLPLLFGMAVVVPPQSWLEAVQQFGYDGGYGRFLRLYFSGGGGGFCRAAHDCLVLPTWNHLWFLPYLMVYTLVLWALLRAWPDALPGLAPRLAAALGGAGLLLWPLAWLVVVRAVLGPRYPATHALVDDWALHAQYLPAFLLGALLQHAPQAWPRFAAQRWAALALAVAAWWLWAVLPTAEALRALGLRPLLVGLHQWAAMVAAIGFAQRWLDRDFPARRALTEAVLPLYLLHQTVIIVAARALAPWAWPPLLEAPVLLVLAFGLSAIGYLVGRRIGGLRPWIGLADRSTDLPIRATIAPH